MNLINILMKCLVFDVIRFESQTRNPLRIQQRILQSILKKNRETLFGKKYNFASIKNIEDFQNNVCVNDYETLRPYIKKMIRGQADVLIKDKPIFYGLTSGTTGKPKFIPVTSYTRRQKAQVTNQWLYYIINEHPRVFQDKVLVIVSPEIEGYVKSGVPYGSESGHGYRNIPCFIRRHYVLPYEVFQIKDYDARYYTILRLGVEANVTNLATLNPLTILILCQKIEKYAQDIIKDIREGTINSTFKIEKDIRSKITGSLRPNPKRAQFLEKILREKGRLLPKYFWSNLALIECWKGGTVGLYLKELRRYFPDSIKVRDFGCLSTEARCSIPCSDEGCAGILAIGINFYEFIPEDDIHTQKPRYLTVEKLEKGKRYFILITTSAGLYRYNIDDIIKVVGFYNKTPIIEFVQKGKNVCSVTGEKLYEDQVVLAMNKARSLTGLDVVIFCCHLEREMPPRYSFLVEFISEPSLQEKQFFLKTLEEGLKRINIEYKSKRRSQRLDNPSLKVLEKGSFENFRKNRLSTSGGDSQFKFCHLSPDFTIPKEFKIKEEIFLKQ